MSKNPSKLVFEGGVGGRERGEGVEEKDGWKVSGGVVRKMERSVRPRVERGARLMKRVKVRWGGGIGCFVC
jgi:hypothetical protein